MSTLINKKKRYNQKTLKVKHSSTESPKAVICLNNGDCVVIYESHCVVFTFSPQEDETQVKVIFKDRILKVFPNKQGFIVFSDKPYLLNNNNLFVPIQIDIDFEDTMQIRYFSQSQQLYQYQGNSYSHTLINLMDNSLKYKDRRQISDGELLQSVDEKETIIISTRKGVITLFNMKLKTSKQYQLPFEDKIKCLYLIGQNQAICARGQKFQMTIWSTEFGKEASCSKHTNIPPQFIIMFNSISTSRHFLLFSNLEEIFVYNYVKRDIVQKFNTSAIQVSRQSSPDFRYFIQLKNNGEITRYSQRRSLKRILMHFYKKSGLESLYGGDGLMQRIAKVVQ